MLHNDDSPPELCLSVLTSRPPQCSGIELIGCVWNNVEASETVLGVTWGRYAVMGHFNGESVTVADVQPAADIAPRPAENPLRLPENAGTTAEADLATYQLQLQLHTEAPFPIESPFCVSRQRWADQLEPQSSELFGVALPVLRDLDAQRQEHARPQQRLDLRASASTDIREP